MDFLFVYCLFDFQIKHAKMVKTDNCLSSVSRTKTRDKIATLCSTPYCKKRHSGKRRNLIKILQTPYFVYYVKRHTTRVFVKEKIVKTYGTLNFTIGLHMHP